MLGQHLFAVSIERFGDLTDGGLLCGRRVGKGEGIETL
jgi:hypothetical protein